MFDETQLIIKNFDQLINDYKTSHFDFIKTLKFEYFSIIDEFPNYEVSTYGNIKNTKTGRILQPSIDSKGYYKINLFKDNNKSYTKNIHRLVANTFILNLYNKKCVDHMDNNKLNNHVQNLRYATNSENNQNTKISKRNTSGIKGISWNKRNKKWQANIALVKNIYIGSFDNLEDAKLVIEKARLRLHGEYCNNG